MNLKVLSRLGYFGIIYDYSRVVVNSHKTPKEKPKNKKKKLWGKKLARFLKVTFDSSTRIAKRERKKIKIMKDSIVTLKNKFL